MNLRFAAATDPGRVRSRNEDRFVADGDLRFFAVVDGMGGHASGDLASVTIADAVTAFIRETAGDSDKTWPDGLDARLSVLAAEPSPPEQMGLDDNADAAELDRLVDRLSARLGRRRVTRLIAQDSHIPELAAAAVPAVPQNARRLISERSAISNSPASAIDKPPVQHSVPSSARGSKQPSSTVAPRKPGTRVGLITIGVASAAAP